MAENKLNFYQKVQKVQYELKVPKNLYNSFGKYKYRNTESIFEAFKPLGKKYGLILTVNDAVYEDNGRFYIMATATLMDVDNPAMNISNNGIARESEDKKGMDSAQVTGATSSYARKYALNGLFLLDDTKDVDTEEYQDSVKKAENKAKTTPVKTIKGDIVAEQIKIINDELQRTHVNINQILKTFNHNNISEFSAAEAEACITKLSGIKTWEEK